MHIYASNRSKPRSSRFAIVLQENCNPKFMAAMAKTMANALPSLICRGKSIEFSTMPCVQSTLAMLESILTHKPENLQSKIYGCHGKIHGERMTTIEFLCQIDGVFHDSVPKIDPGHARVDSDMFCKKFAIQNLWLLWPK
jgi:hypothetical protein